METYQLTRSIPVEEEYDIVVAGGGPGGSAAAISAARLGAKVLLVEALGCLGGTGTSGLVCNWFRLSDGSRTVIGGLLLETLETMFQRGLLPMRAKPKIWRVLGFDPEGLKVLLDDLCADAGVEVRFFTRVIDADVDGENRKVNGVVLHNIEGYSYIPAKAFVDATGDAVLTDLCGAPCREAGRDTEGIMPPTLCAALSNINFESLANQQKAVLKGIEDGFFSQPDQHVPGIFRTGEHTAILNAGHVFGMDALNCRSLSDGMVRGRKLTKEYVDFFRKYSPGCKDMEFMSTGALMGIRESRRIVGEYELNYDDYKARRHFPDQIAVYRKEVDVHVYDCSDEQYELYRGKFTDTLKPGETYGLPYRILVPKGWQNLWVAGRCNSSDIEMHGAIRDQPACFMMGEASGTAAVQSINTQQPAFDLDTEQLVSTLRKNGAYIP